jgi:hypothetical protein
MPPPKIAKIVSGLFALDSTMIEPISSLVAAIGAARIPVCVRETRRTLERQHYYFRKGWTLHRGNGDPHPWGFAVDFCLDVRSPLWARIGDRPLKALDGGGPEYDTGYEPLPVGPTLMRPGVARVWRIFGELVQLDRRLRWGGILRGDVAWSGYEFGDAVDHVELVDWKRRVHDADARPS